MWTVSWQDFRRHAYGDPMPPVQRETFTDKGEADRRKTELRSERVIACVTPLVIRHETRFHNTPIDGEGPRFNAGWTLAK
jgi:hypothetical protein